MKFNHIEATTYFVDKTYFGEPKFLSSNGYKCVVYYNYKNYKIQTFSYAI